MDELQLARELADAADELSMRYFEMGVETSAKADGTLVTVADKEIEQVLRTRIKETFPDHGLLGEEHGLEGDPSKPTWILDPIDGTNNFAWGIQIFATLIALRIDGRTEIGIASAPALRERYVAVRGGGAELNGTPISVSDISSIEESRVCYGSHRGIVQFGLGDKWAEILQRCYRERGFGDFWGHMLVARGAAEVMIEPALAIWDVAALEVIVEEAGGRITGFTGAPYPNSRMTSKTGDPSCLTTNGKLHQELVTALSD